jgi:hypothetical protein
MPEYKTLFAKLGVEPSATDAEIDEAWDAHVLAAGSVTDVPKDVTFAYRFLKIADNRREYRALLDICLSGEGYALRKDQVEDVRAFCRQVGLKMFADPYADGVFYFRTPLQNPPTFTPKEPRPGPQPFDPVQWERPKERPRGRALVASVVLASAFAVLAGGGVVWPALRDRSGAGAPSPEAAAREAAEREARELRDAIRNGHALALSEARAVEDLRTLTERQFVDAVGVRPGAGPPPRELDRLIIRSREVAEAWEEIVSSLPPADSLSRITRTLGDINARIGAGTFLPDDRDALDQIVGSVAQQKTRLLQQQGNITFIREMLEIERFSETTPNERSEGS